MGLAYVLLNAGHVCERERIYIYIYRREEDDNHDKLA